MALPENIYEMIDPPKGALFQEWGDRFGRYKWCYLAGMNRFGTYGDMRVKSDKNNNLIPLSHKYKKLLKDSDFTSQAIAWVPAKWRNHPDFAHLDWEMKLSPLQVENALDVRALCFPRACLVLAVFNHLLTEKEKIDLDLREKVRIRPAIFRVRAFSEDFYRNNFKTGPEAKNRLSALMQYSGQSHPIFYEELSSGYPATYFTLERISQGCNDIGCRIDGEIVPILYRAPSDRPDLTTSQRHQRIRASPARHERIHMP